MASSLDVFVILQVQLQLVFPQAVRTLDLHLFDQRGLLGFESCFGTLKFVPPLERSDVVASLLLNVRLCLGCDHESSDFFRRSDSLRLIQRLGSRLQVGLNSRSFVLHLHQDQLGFDLGIRQYLGRGRSISDVPIEQPLDQGGEPGRVTRWDRRPTSISRGIDQVLGALREAIPIPGILGYPRFVTNPLLSGLKSLWRIGRLQPVVRSTYEWHACSPLTT